MKERNVMSRYLSVSLVLTGILLGSSVPSTAQEDGFTSEFGIEDCDFTATGRNPFFILEPGHQLTLSGQEDEETVTVTITVLDETEVVDGVETRVVEEYETIDGELAEISRNFFAICTKTNDVFYFGEDVDNYDEEGNVEDHDGSWRAGVDGARPGLVMPGTITLGSKYYQEVAPEIALDRAEHVGITSEITTPVGAFVNCLRIEESTPLEEDEVSYKMYAPGIGMVQDDDLILTEFVGTLPVMGEPVEQIDDFTRHFMLDECEFTNVGRNRFFIMEPGYKLVLEGEEDEEVVTVTITVLDDTEVVDGVVTRVIEERETADGELTEISRNFFAICTRTNSVFYFGEDVDNYDEEGNVADHEGSWRAGVDGARPGLTISGTVLLGSRYYQETAEDIAMDRGENKSLDETAVTPAGIFEDCLLVEESSGLEPDDLSIKVYAPGIGMVQDNDLMLIEHSFRSSVDAWELMR